MDGLEAIGRAYLALLVGAPLILYPLAWRVGLPLWARVTLSLVPGFLWWLIWEEAKAIYKRLGN